MQFISHTVDNDDDDDDDDDSVDGVFEDSNVHNYDGHNDDCNNDYYILIMMIDR